MSTPTLQAPGPSAGGLTLGALAFCAGVVAGYSVFSGCEDAIAREEAASKTASQVATKPARTATQSFGSLQQSSIPREASRQYWAARDRTRSLQNQLDHARRERDRHRGTYPADRSRASFDEAYWQADQEKLEVRVRELEMEVLRHDAELERYRCDNGAYGGECWH